MMFSTAILIVINLALISGSLVPTEKIPSADEIFQKASEAANIPGLNASALPVEEAKTAFKKKCEINGGPKAYTGAENAAREIESCVRGLVNVTILQDEIEKAKPTGDLDIVFRKYCKKRTILESCVKNFTSSVETCFTQKERDNVRIIQNITESLLSFVCFKEGDRIALFIAAGGPQCFASKQTEIQDCFNSTFGSYMPADGLPPPSANGLDNLPLLLLDTKKCTDIEKLQSCIVQKLEKCDDPTPGNIADSLFNFIKRVTPCENLLSKSRADASVGQAIDMKSTSTIPSAHFIVVALSFLSLVSITSK